MPFMDFTLGFTGFSYVRIPQYTTSYWIYYCPLLEATPNFYRSGKCCTRPRVVKQGKCMHCRYRSLPTGTGMMSTSRSHGVHLNNVFVFVLISIFLDIIMNSSFGCAWTL